MAWPKTIVRAEGGALRVPLPAGCERLRKAVEAGADVKIVYDAESTYKAGNEATIALPGLDQADAVIPRTVTEGIRHNKFIVLLKDETPVAVWTGSTNISKGGIFGHSNVGHIVWDERCCQSLSRLLGAACRQPHADQAPTAQSRGDATSRGRPAQNSVTPLFSARDGAGSSETLQWYADRMNEAEQIVCFTVAFNIDKVFQDVLAQDNDVLRYVVKDDDLGDGEIIGQRPRRTVRGRRISRGRRADEFSEGARQSPEFATTTSTTSSCWSIRLAMIRSS